MIGLLCSLEKGKLENLDFLIVRFQVQSWAYEPQRFMPV